eukprot:scaffold12890_cov52-Attheya_sp.AAC.4
MGAGPSMLQVSSGFGLLFRASSCGACSGQTGYLTSCYTFAYLLLIRLGIEIGLPSGLRAPCLMEAAYAILVLPYFVFGTIIGIDFGWDNRLLKRGLNFLLTCSANIEVADTKLDGCWAN